MADLEAHVPQHVEHLLDNRADLLIDVLHSIGMEEHNIDVAVRIQLTAPISADRNERNPRKLLLQSRILLHRSIEQMSQHDIHQACPLRANVATAPTTVMLEANP